VEKPLQIFGIEGHQTVSCPPEPGGFSAFLKCEATIKKKNYILEKVEQANSKN
jgi:hypothetical protein